MWVCFNQDVALTARGPDGYAFDKTEIRTQRKRLENVGSTANTTIKMHRNFPSNRFDRFRERLQDR